MSRILQLKDGEYIISVSPFRKQYRHPFMISFDMDSPFENSDRPFWIVVEELLLSMGFLKEVQEGWILYRKDEITIDNVFSMGKYYITSNRADILVTLKLSL